MNKKLIVSVHDVTPEYRSELEGVISELDKLGINKTSLMVIPNYRKNNRLENDSNFVTWLKDLENKGNEIVQHGYDHLFEGKKDSSFYRNFLGEILNFGGQGEFQYANYNSAKERICKGKEILDKVGFNPKGFVGQSWFISDDTLKAAFDEGFEYVDRLNDIILANGNIIKSPLIAFEPNSKLLGKFVRTYFFLIEPYINSNELCRIAVHPQDYRNVALFNYIKANIRKNVENRGLTTYYDYIKSKRS